MGEHKQKVEKHRENKKNKMADLITNVSIITLNVSGLNTPIKKVESRIIE